VNGEQIPFSSPRCPDSSVAAQTRSPHGLVRQGYGILRDALVRHVCVSHLRWTSAVQEQLSLLFFAMLFLNTTSLFFTPDKLRPRYNKQM